MAFYDKVQEYLVKINTEIDSANNVKVDERTPRSYLNELEALKAKKDLYAEVVCNLSSYRQEKKVFDPHAFNSQTNELGCVVEKHYRMNSSCEFKNELAKVKRMIRITEDKISECNVKVHIGSSFEYWNDVTEELESMI